MAHPSFAPQPLERRRLQCALALIVADMAAIFGGFPAAGYLRCGLPGLGHGWLWAQLLLPLFLTFGLLNGAYSAPALMALRHSALRAVAALVLAAAAVLFITVWAETGRAAPRAALGGEIAIAALGIGLARLPLRRFVRWRCGNAVIRELLIDDGGPAVHLPGAEHVVLAEHGLYPALDDPQMLHRIGALLAAADHVLVSCPPGRRAIWATILKSANVAGAVLDDAVAELGALDARVTGGHGWLQVASGPLGLRDRAIKRAFDLILAGAVFLALCPLLLAAAVAIRVEDGGPVLFVQRRVGRGNRFFNLYKFRSLRVAGGDASGARAITRGDARMTCVGRLIRRTSIDELPQLLNVLRGEMSVVGPRPHTPDSQVANKPFWTVDGRYWQRHALKPGITGLAQVRGLRGTIEHEAELAGRLSADLEYLHGWSLWRDCQIICATLGVLIHDRAY